MKTPVSLLILFLLTVSLFFGSSCKKEIVLSNLSGVVQKGPFINGTQVSVFELDGSLTQTGNRYMATISNDRGLFQLGDLPLASNYLKLVAEGYYFNEVWNEISDGPLTLNAVSDISDRSTVNVNMLTHLESGRLENLMEDGYSLSEAKKISQTEILSTFGFELEETIDSESLTIENASEGNAVLLALSLMIMGEKSTSELTETLAELRTDFQDNGILNNKNSFWEIRTRAINLNMAGIRRNLEFRNRVLRINDAIVPDFEKYIDTFLVYTNTPRQVTDIDGNDYRVTTIGSQVWMAENLKTTRYRDGSEITFFTDESNRMWSEYTQGAYCWYQNDDSIGEIYGNLYNWHAVNDPRGLCPDGWRVPTISDWDALRLYLGRGSAAWGEAAGVMLKERGLEHWASPNFEAMDSYGFTALPGGWREIGFYFDRPLDYYFNHLSHYAFFWSSEKWPGSDIDGTLEWLIYDNGNFGYMPSRLNFGASVRCLKENN